MTPLFIPALLAHDMDAFYTKLGIVVTFWFLIIAASLLDLITGIQASKRTGTKRTNSWGLRKTVNKDLQYLAIMLAFLFIDFASSALSEHLPIFAMPIASSLGVISITVIEGLSVRENLAKGKAKDENKIDDLENLAKGIIKTIPDEKIRKLISLLEESKKTNGK